MEIWSFIETENNRLLDVGPKMATEACKISRKFKAKPCGVVASLSDTIIKELEPYGLEKIYFIKEKESASSEDLVGSFQSLVSKYSPEFFLFSSSVTGSELGTRLAAKMKKGIITNYVDIDSKKEGPVARRPIYGVKAHNYIKWMTPAPYLATASLDTIETVEARESVTPEIETEIFKLKKMNNRPVKQWKVDISKLDITEADVVVGVGRGVDRPEFMEEIEKLADLLNGVVGGTRIAVFDGLIPKEKLVGVSGSWISPTIYIAIGIAGVPQHSMGLKDAKHVIAINTQKTARIFKISEFGMLGDLYEAVPQLINIIENSDTLKEMRK